VNPDHHSSQNLPVTALFTQFNLLLATGLFAAEK
jgi:hypothetical protein